jgi:uncharacterized protein
MSIMTGKEWAAHSAIGARHFARLLVLAVALIQGCETIRVEPELEPATASTAEKAELAGEYVLAAREYERLAKSAVSPQKQNYEMHMVTNLIKAGQIPTARENIKAIDVRGLDPSFRARKHILEAQIALAEGFHERAIRLLDSALRVRHLNPTLLAEVYRVRARAELALENPIGAVKNLIEREQYMVGKEAIAENQLQLWKVLDSLTRTRLVSELNHTREPMLSGWIELAIASIENAGSTNRMVNAVAQWKQRFPQHPANESLLSSLASTSPGLIGRIDRIALLLPLSSTHAVAAQAVHDGFMAMNAANTDPDKPKIMIYDIGADPERGPDFYAKAVNDGAQMVVGPLGRQAVDAVIRSDSLVVPTLLLNHTDEGSGFKHLFQFGLPPEQEARQAAERAYLDGHRQAVALYPNTSWGERMMHAFSAHWQRLGGIVLSSQTFTEGESDYSEPIKRLLNINESEARKASLENKLGQKLKFEARPRQDVDLIFLVADARHGRLLKPQLNYYHAARLPVYSTSHIFTGKSDPIHDVDLDGVRFGDMPWMLVDDGKILKLRETLQQNWPHAHSDLDRLYALGIDSYAIIPHLNRIRLEDAGRFSGVTSGLSLDRDGRLHRQLVWAKFRKGVPRLLDRF